LLLTIWIFSHSGGLRHSTEVLESSFVSVMPPHARRIALCRARWLR